MTRLLFAADLDNTLIRSHRRRRAGDVCVEWLEGHPQSFMSPRAVELLRSVCRVARFVPVTTRSQAQYRRIRFPEGCAPALAVTAHGATLLTGEGPDPDWRERAQALVSPFREELMRMLACVEGSSLVDDAFLFLACETPEAARKRSGALAAQTRLRVLRGGRKLYLVPPGLHKGQALDWLRQLLRERPVVAAGDCEMDAELLAGADVAVCPRDLPLPPAGRVLVCPEGRDFTEYILETCLRHAEVSV